VTGAVVDFDSAAKLTESKWVGFGFAVAVTETVIVAGVVH
jgi:hypothetical protein